jgi:hypothetical protein
MTSDASDSDPYSSAARLHVTRQPFADDDGEVARTLPAVTKPGACGSKPIYRTNRPNLAQMAVNWRHFAGKPEALLVTR